MESGRTEYVSASAADSVRSNPPAIPDHELLRCIGRGSYGEVWLARSITGAWRAVKVIYRHGGEQAKAFEREFRGIQNYEPISRVDESLMDILHVGRSESEAFFYYVMELADAAASAEVQSSKLKAQSSRSSQSEADCEVTPSNRESGTWNADTYSPRTLRSELTTQGRLTISDCVDLGLALTSALKVLHSHALVHRDIKPSNIIYVNGRPKLSDIGLVAASDATVSFVGTIGYLPPEGPGSPQADLYSLGKVLYEASTGKDRQQFPEPVTELESGEDVAALSELNEVILKACQPSARNRYRGAAEMQEDLELIRVGKSVRRLRTLERRFRVAAMAAVGLLVLGLGGYFIQRTRELARLAAEREKHFAIQQMQSIRLNSRRNGWSDSAWQVGAAVRSPVDRMLLDHLAGALVGLDAHVFKGLTNFHAVSAVFDASGTKLLLGRPTNGPMLWNLQTEQMTPLSQGFGPASFVSEETQWAGLGERSVLLYRAGANETKVTEFMFSDEPRQPRLRPLALRPVVLSTDGGFMAAAAHSDDGVGTTAVWDIRSGQRVISTGDSATALALSTDNSLFAEARINGAIVIFSLNSGQELMRLNSEATVHTLAFRCDPEVTRRSSDLLQGWWLATGEAGGKVTVWDLSQRLPKANLRRSLHDVYELAFSPDGTLLATGGRQATRIWDLANEQLLLQIDKADGMTGLAFSPDGRRLAVSFANKQEQMVIVSELQNGRGLQTLFGLSSQVGQLYLSPDERLLAALSHDWKIALWELPRGNLRAILRVPRGRQTTDNAGIAISPDSSRLAFVAGTNATLWDLHTFRTLAEKTLPAALGDTLRFHPSGKLLLFRNESDTDEMSPGGRREVFRIYDVLSEPLRPIVEVTNVASRVLCVASPQDASFFAAETTFFTKEGRRRQVKVLDGLTGMEWWAATVTTKADFAGIRLDPSGHFLAYNSRVGPQPPPETVIVDARSGKLHRVVQGSVYGLGPDGTWRLVVGLPYLPGRGYTVVEIPSGTPQLGLGIDFEINSVAPVIGRSGSLIAWANLDGTVIVCDLIEVQKRLATVGAPNSP